MTSFLQKLFHKHKWGRIIFETEEGQEFTLKECTVCHKKDWNCTKWSASYTATPKFEYEETLGE